MAVFKKRRKPLDPLVVDLSAADAEVAAQDNVPGPNALDFEAITAREKAIEANRGSVGRSFGRLRTEADLHPGPVLDPEAAAEND